MQKGKSKYRNRKVVIDGNTFDSHKEASAYIYFKGLLSQGKVTNLELQPIYELIPPQYITLPTGKKKIKERALTYRADFRVTYADGHVEIIDVKGMRTDVYRIKRKLMLLMHEISIVEM